MILKKYEENLYLILTFKMKLVMNAIIYNHKYKSTPKMKKKLFNFFTTWNKKVGKYYFWWNNF